MTDLSVGEREATEIAYEEWPLAGAPIRDAFYAGWGASREYSKQREDELLRAVEVAAHAAFDYATESDEHGDRFAMWWGVYSHEALAENGDGQSDSMRNRLVVRRTDDGLQVTFEEKHPDGLAHRRPGA